MRRLLLASLLISCGGSKPPPPAPAKAVEPPPPVAQQEPPPPPPEDKPAEPPPPPPPPPALDPPPWAADALDSAKVPKVYLAELKKAKNKATCPLLVITDVADGAKPRAANFDGGWAVAYDTKKVRSAFGVAGAGIEKGGGPGWPNNIKWSDGSTAGYGPEGGTGPKSLAYVEVSDAGCLYNVCSAMGEEHLVQVIKSLRHVK